MGSMEGILYCTLNVFCICILLTILLRIIKSSDKRMSQTMYSLFIMSSAILCTSDLVWGIVDFSYQWHFSDSVDFVVNFIYHIFTLIVSYMWYLYSESELETRTTTTKKGLITSMIPFAVGIVIILGSFNEGWVFSINDEGVYERGNLYILHIGICFFYILLTSLKAFIRSFYKDNYLKREKYRTLASFCVFPLVMGILQVVLVGSPMISAGVTFAALQVYISTREQLISVDPLTKLNNRTEMVKYLDNKMKNVNPNKDLYLFITDIDSFKRINDKLGHVEGDLAIIMAADALKNAVRKTNFFISRYGGDEFVIIGETKKDFDPKEFRELINLCLEEETKKHNKAYNLHMSVGYFKYTPEIKSISEFIGAADKYLYKQKSERLLKHNTDGKAKSKKNPVNE